MLLEKGLELWIGRWLKQISDPHQEHHGEASAAIVNGLCDCVKCLWESFTSISEIFFSYHICRTQGNFNKQMNNLIVFSHIKINEL